MPLSSDLIRGHTDTIVLAHLLREDSYGYRISRDILTETNKQFELKEATLYSAFRRLEKEGLVRSYWGDEGAGARRRYYSITDSGREAYLQQRQAWESVKKTIDTLISDKEGS